MDEMEVQTLKIYHSIQMQTKKAIMILNTKMTKCTQIKNSHPKDLTSFE